METANANTTTTTINRYILTEYRDHNLSLDLYENFLTEDEASLIKNYFDTSINWRNNKPNKEGRSNRQNALYSEEGKVKYTIKYRQTLYTRETVDWDPVIKILKEKLEALLPEETFTVCMLQKYKDGTVGIKPHRDKEILSSTEPLHVEGGKGLICGISVGATRTLRMSYYNKSYNIPLPSGSLYIFNPPTNNYWTHCIPVDENIKDARYSATFRTY